MPNGTMFGDSDFRHRVESGFFHHEDDNDHDDDDFDFDPAETAQHSRDATLTVVLCVVAAVCVIAALVACFCCHRRRCRARLSQLIVNADSEAARRPDPSAPHSTGTLPPVLHSAPPYRAQAESLHPEHQATTEPCIEAESCSHKEPSAPIAEELPPSYEQATGVKY